MSKERIKPARPDVEGRRAFGPRLPWKWLIIGGSALTILLGGYWLREWRRTEELRAQILRAYEDGLTPSVERYQSFRQKLEGWITEAANQDPPATHADPRLRISALHRGQGLYLRLRADDAKNAEGIARGAASMEADAITRCLGISPISARGLYEKGDFLDPSWIDRARDASGYMRLRVVDDELSRRTDRDLPMLLNMMQSQYFLLVIERGDRRSEHPVDAYLWDLRRDELLLSGRTEAHGLLIPVQIRMEDGRPAGRRAAGNVQTGGAADCSIAAQIKEIAGETAVTFGSDMPELEAEPEAPAADGEIAEDDDGEESQGAEGNADAHGSDPEGASARESTRAAGAPLPESPAANE